MIIDIAPLTVTTPGGDVVCTKAEVNLAIGRGVNIRIVPQGPDGTLYPDAAMPIVDRPGAMAAFEAAVKGALEVLVPQKRAAMEERIRVQREREATPPRAR